MMIQEDRSASKDHDKRTNKTGLGSSQHDSVEESA